MAAALAESKSLKLARALLGPGYQGSGSTRRFHLKRGPFSVEMLESGNRQRDRIFLLSPGFGSALSDYGPLISPLERLGLVVRLRHPGTDRRSTPRVYFHFLWQRWRGLSAAEAARKVRTRIHSRENRLRRLEQLKIAADYYRESRPELKISVAGHSFGSDTALLYTLDHEVDELLLYGNHPPDYLIPNQDYSLLKARCVRVFTGSRDFTRDGVGPQERLRIADFLDSDRLGGVHCLEAVEHMSFAFWGWGPDGWESTYEKLFE